MFVTSPPPFYRGGVVNHSNYVIQLRCLVPDRTSCNVAFLKTMVTLSLLVLWDDIYRRKLFGVEFMYQKKMFFLFDTMFV